MHTAFDLVQEFAVLPPLLLEDASAPPVAASVLAPPVLLLDAPPLLLLVAPPLLTPLLLDVPLLLPVIALASWPIGPLLLFVRPPLLLVALAASPLLLLVPGAAPPDPPRPSVPLSAPAPLPLPLSSPIPEDSPLLVGLSAQPAPKSIAADTAKKACLSRLGT